MIARVRGTEDILDMTLRSTLVHAIERHLVLHNFMGIEVPIIEHTQLFQHTLGQTTDIVSKEMYTFETESGKSICLRPEATASVMRACVENAIDRFPWKVFTYGPMFRRERPQKGRQRQFTQVSLEIIGAPNIAHDAHMLSMLDALFKDVFKLTEYVLHLNFLGCHQDRLTHKEKLVDYLTSQASLFCTTCLDRTHKNPLRVFDCKNEGCKSQLTNAPRITDFLCISCTAEWRTIGQMLQLLGVNFIVNTLLVRGLDYYHKIVFEFCSTSLGSQNAFCGGGRYLLGSAIGARHDHDSIGAGIGIERLELILEAQKSALLQAQPPRLHIIMPLSPAQDNLALIIAQSLLRKNLCVDIILEKASTTNMLKKASKLGAHAVIFLGDEEQKNNTATIKIMQNGESITVPQGEIFNILNKNIQKYGNTL